MAAPPVTRTVALGKQRRLAQITDGAGRCALVAADQRGNLRRALRPDDPDSVTYDEMVAFKGDVVEALGPCATGVLVDPEFGAAQVIRSGQLPGGCGLIVAVEETGYEADATDRRTALIDGFDPAKAARMGASAAKLLLYFHPEAGRAAAQVDTVRRVAEQCAAAELPLVVEPLSFSLDPRRPLSSAERRRVVVESARVLSALDVDLVKAEFPLDVTVDADHGAWHDACAELSEACAVPWVLLSAGVGFELFATQARIACEAGAIGVLAGRAVWREAADLAGEERRRFLTGAATGRMRRLRAIVEAYARPITTGLDAPAPVVERWFEAY